MARYHINSKGEAGKCSATQGKCPFGGDANHYDSPEKAQQAFELSMASSTVAPVAKKAVARRPAPPEEGDEVKIHHDAALFDNTYAPYQGQTGTVLESHGSSYTVMFADTAILRMPHEVVLSLPQNRFKPEEWGGFQKQDLEWDAKATEQVVRGWPAWKNASDESIRKQVDSMRQSWETRARTEPAKSYEENVPMRLIPVGSKVHAPFSKGDPYKQVGRPVVNEKDDRGTPTDVAGRYWDGVQWDYVSGDTLFKTGRVEDGKALAPAWKEENRRAAELAAWREAYSTRD